MDSLEKNQKEQLNKHLIHDIVQNKIIENYYELFPIEETLNDDILVDVYYEPEDSTFWYESSGMAYSGSDDKAVEIGQIENGHIINTTLAFDKLVDDQSVSKSNNEEIKQFKNERNYTAEQLEALEWGFNNGLTVEQANKHFNDHDYDPFQIKQIASGYIENLTSEEVELYATPTYDSSQMVQIQIGLMKELPSDKLEILINPDYSGEEMALINDAFENGLSLEETKVIANPDLSYEQMLEVGIALEQGLSVEEVSRYADPNLSPSEIEDKTDQLRGIRPKNLNTIVYDGANQSYDLEFHDDYSDRIFYISVDADDHLEASVNEDYFDENRVQSIVDEYKEEHIYTLDNQYNQPIRDDLER